MKETEANKKGDRMKCSSEAAISSASSLDAKPSVATTKSRPATSMRSAAATKVGCKAVVTSDRGSLATKPTLASKRTIGKPTINVRSANGRLSGVGNVGAVRCSTKKSTSSVTRKATGINGHSRSTKVHDAENKRSSNRAEKAATIEPTTEAAEDSGACVVPSLAEPGPSTEQPQPLLRPSPSLSQSSLKEQPLLSSMMPLTVATLRTSLSQRMMPTNRKPGNEDKEHGGDAIHSDMPLKEVAEEIITEDDDNVARHQLKRRRSTSTRGSDDEKSPTTVDRINKECHDSECGLQHPNLGSNQGVAFATEPRCAIMHRQSLPSILPSSSSFDFARRGGGWRVRKKRRPSLCASSFRGGALDASVITCEETKNTSADVPNKNDGSADPSLLHQSEGSASSALALGEAEKSSHPSMQAHRADRHHHTTDGVKQKDAEEVYGNEKENVRNVTSTRGKIVPIMLDKLKHGKEHGNQTKGIGDEENRDGQETSTTRRNSVSTVTSTPREDAANQADSKAESSSASMGCLTEKRLAEWTAQVQTMQRGSVDRLERAAAMFAAANEADVQLPCFYTDCLNSRRPITSGDMYEEDDCDGEALFGRQRTDGVANFSLARNAAVPWMLYVQSKLENVSDETFHLAVSLLDQWLMLLYRNSRKVTECSDEEEEKRRAAENEAKVLGEKLQALVVACVLTATRFEDEWSVDLKDLLDLSTTHKEHDLILQYNMKLLSSCSLGVPTAREFVRLFVSASDNDAEWPRRLKLFICPDKIEKEHGQRRASAKESVTEVSAATAIAPSDVILAVSYYLSDVLLFHCDTAAAPPYIRAAAALIWAIVHTTYKFSATTVKGKLKQTVRTMTTLTMAAADGEEDGEMRQNSSQGDIPQQSSQLSVSREVSRVDMSQEESQVTMSQKQSSEATMSQEESSQATVPHEESSQFTISQEESSQITMSQVGSSPTELSQRNTQATQRSDGELNHSSAKVVYKAKSSIATHRRCTRRLDLSHLPPGTAHLLNHFGKIPVYKLSKAEWMQEQQNGGSGAVLEQAEEDKSWREALGHTVAMADELLRPHLTRCEVDSQHLQAEHTDEKQSGSNEPTVCRFTEVDDHGDDERRCSRRTVVRECNLARCDRKHKFASSYLRECLRVIHLKDSKAVG